MSAAWSADGWTSSHPSPAGEKKRNVSNMKKNTRKVQKMGVTEISSISLEQKKKKGKRVRSHLKQCIITALLL